MTNPVARVWEVVYNRGNDIEHTEKSVLTFCPGCKRAHPFCIDNGGGSRFNGTSVPTWAWDGNLESPTFNPSMLCYSTVQTCKGSHTVEPCEDHENCEEQFHTITNYYEVEEEEDWVYGHDRSNHEGNCTWGNCHSFLHNGQWQFLSDSAHELAGQTVPMIPLPDFLMKRGF